MTIHPSVNPNLGIASLFAKLNLLHIYSSFSYKHDRDNKAYQKHRYALVYYNQYITINKDSIIQSPIYEDIWKFGTGDIPCRGL